MMAFRGVLFDLDGTLVDSLHDIAAACNHALRELGHAPQPLRRYAQIAGGGTQRLMSALLAERLGAAPDAATLGAAVDLKLRFEEHSEHSGSVPFDGVHQMLRQLAASNVPMAVLSNKLQRTVRRVVDGVFPDVPFVYVAGATEHAPLKPHPHMALHIVHNYFDGVAPQQCLFVGDTEVDMGTAASAGMTGVGVPWGFRSAEQLRQSGASRVIGAAADICAMVREQPRQ